MYTECLQNLPLNYESGVTAHIIIFLTFNTLIINGFRQNNNVKIGICYFSVKHSSFTVGTWTGQLEVKSVYGHYGDKCMTSYVHDV